MRALITSKHDFPLSGEMPEIKYDRPRSAHLEAKRVRVTNEEHFKLAIVLLSQSLSKVCRTLNPNIEVNLVVNHLDRGHNRFHSLRSMNFLPTFTPHPLPVKIGKHNTDLSLKLLLLMVGLLLYGKWRKL